MKLARIESAVRQVLDYNQAYNRHDVPAMLALLDPHCRQETATGGVLVGPTAIRDHWQEHFNSHPQAHCQVEDVFGFGFRCVLRWECSWAGADGQQLHQRGVDIFQIKNSLIAEILTYLKD